jgi:hypothetical protein
MTQKLAGGLPDRRILQTVPFERDPLSKRYDATTGRLLGRAYSQPGRWVYTTVPRPKPGPRTLAWLRRLGIQLDPIDSGGLTRYERAYQRSLYYVHNGGGDGARNGVWSLQRQWGPVTVKGRMLGVRAGAPKDARLAVNRNRGDAWYRNPELQSGGIGSVKQRFPA